MSTKLQSPGVDGDLRKEEKENEDKIIKDIEQEIECPRCSDTMTLSSDFDKLLYVCQGCDLLLLMNQPKIDIRTSGTRFT